MMSFFKSAAPVAALFLVTACGSGGVGAAGCAVGFGVEGSPRIELRTGATPVTVEVVGLSDDDRLEQWSSYSTREQWQAVFRVSVAPDQPPMLGDYRVDGDRIIFTPMFPLEPGKQYHAVFMPPSGVPMTATIGLPATHTTPTSVVAHVYPSGEVVPENQLRLYIHFSAPMGMKGGLDYVHLLDEEGKEVVDPFLPLDVEFWNDDRTRYTVFFDPGRQKRGIAPIADMGRSLTEGKTYTLVIDADWRDGNGLPLKQPFRRAFRVGPPDERPLDPKAWTIVAPRAGTTEPLTVTFREPLDHGLLLRALGVLAPGGASLPGDVVVGPSELTWSFTPRTAWPAGQHHLVAFASLEDLAGNRIGRAFEVDQFDRSDRRAEPEKTLIPFSIH